LLTARATSAGGEERVGALARGRGAWSRRAAVNTHVMPSSSRNKLTIYAGTAALLAVLAIAAGVLAGSEFAVPIAILAVLVLGFLMLNDLLARRSLARHGADADAAQDDGDDALPAAHLIPDDRPLGDTAEAHDEISPHDLPKDSPARRAAEAQAARHGGTTRGDRDGGQGGPSLDSEESVPA
jgi:hypothetical protein